MLSTIITIEHSLVVVHATSMAPQRAASNGHQTVRQTQHWEPPQDGWVKLNVDGSYHELTGEAGVAVWVQLRGIGAGHGTFYCLDTSKNVEVQLRPKPLPALKVFVGQIIGAYPR